MIRATHSGKLDQFPGSPDVYVLEDGRRMISMRGAKGILTGNTRAGSLERYVSRLPQEYADLRHVPAVEFLASTPGGMQVIKGVEAQWLFRVCMAYTRLRARDDLRQNQHSVATHALGFVHTSTMKGAESLFGNGAEDASPANSHVALAEFFRNQPRDWSRIATLSGVYDA